MKKFCIIIVTILILVLLFFVKYKWYSEGMSINILSGKYPMFSLIGKVDLNGKISTDGTKEGYLAFGIATVVILILFISGMQLFFLEVLGEYVGAIHVQVRKKPLVVIRDNINFSQSELNHGGTINC